jgi:ATP-binding cassette, subfamily B, bacterial
MRRNPPQHPPSSPAAPSPKAVPKGFAGVFAHMGQALRLVWGTHRGLTVALGLLSLIAGLLPAGIAWVGAHIVDSVVAAMAAYPTAGRGAFEPVLRWVVLEAGLVAALAAVARGLSTCQSLLRAQLGQRVNVMILEKALSLSLAQFEDSEFYDRLTRARREASSRPLSMVMRTFGLVRDVVQLASFSGLLWQFSPLAMLVLLLAGVPAFIAEAKFSGDAFRLFRWRSPEARMQLYLESVLAREDHAKEVQLYGLGPLFLDRYRGIFDKLYSADRALTIRRDSWGLGLGLLGTVALYGAYAWVAVVAIMGRLTLGQMTLYVALFRQGQSALSGVLAAVGGLYEDNLYLSTLTEYLAQPAPARGGAAKEGPDPSDGIRFENVSFTYPGGSEPALQDLTLHIRPGQALAIVGENGSGKTTLIKLLTRLYTPTAGRILLDGRDLQEWDEVRLRERIGVIFQDFARYQLEVGENVGVGDVHAFTDEARWREAATAGLAMPFIDELPKGFQTRLGKWFQDGRELSGGQWQKIALSRAFMRTGADIVVLDEPTAAMDAAAEAEVFAHFRDLTAGRIAVLISHRFSTVRMADQIAVLEHGRLQELGSHAELLARDGRYATLFKLQARGYA